MFLIFPSPVSYLFVCSLVCLFIRLFGGDGVCVCLFVRLLVSFSDQSYACLFVYLFVHL